MSVIYLDCVMDVPYPDDRCEGGLVRLDDVPDELAEDEAA